MNKNYTIKGESCISAVIGLSSYYVNDSKIGTVQEILRKVSSRTCQCAVLIFLK